MCTLCNILGLPLGDLRDAVECVEIPVFAIDLRWSGDGDSKSLSVSLNLPIFAIAPVTIP